MAKRIVKCSLCDGSKKCEVAGEMVRCIECAGIGTFEYGFDRPVADLEIEYQQLVAILESVCLDLDRWEWSKRLPDDELIWDDKSKRNVPAKLKEQVDYWKFHTDAMRTELEKRRVPNDERILESEHETAFSLDGSGRTKQREAISRGTGRRAKGVGKARV